MFIGLPEVKFIAKKFRLKKCIAKILQGFFLGKFHQGEFLLQKFRLGKFC